MFEFDPKKSAANRLKHGIDFLEAQRIWDAPYLVERPARSLTEARFRVLGLIDTTLWAAIVTYRHDHIRLISVRRARQEEVDFYLRAREMDHR
jgi:uncharacterized DUF497 family protein